MSVVYFWISNDRSFFSVSICACVCMCSVCTLEFGFAHSLYFENSNERFHILPPRLQPSRNTLLHFHHRYLLLPFPTGILHYFLICSYIKLFIECVVCRYVIDTVNWKRKRKIRMQIEIPNQLNDVVVLNLVPNDETTTNVTNGNEMRAGNKYTPRASTHSLLSMCMYIEKHAQQN